MENTPTSINTQDIKYLADLARIEVQPEEAVHLVEDLSAILDYVAKLQSVDITNVKPMAENIDSANLRPDQAVKFPDSGELLLPRIGSEGLLEVSNVFNHD